MQPPERPARIYMAAIGPQMTRLAGELADGILGYCYSAEYVRETRAAEPAAPARSAPDARSKASTSPVASRRSSRRRAGLEQVKGQVMMFATAKSSSPEYATSFAAAGHDVAPIQERVDAGDVKGALALVTRRDGGRDDDRRLARQRAPADRRVPRRRADDVGLNPSPPDVWFPLYQGHFPDSALAKIPEFSFPAYLGVIDATLDLAGS